MNISAKDFSEIPGLDPSLPCSAAKSAADCGSGTATPLPEILFPRPLMMKVIREPLAGGGAATLLPCERIDPQYGVFGIAL